MNLKSKYSNIHQIPLFRNFSFIFKKQDINTLTRVFFRLIFFNIQRLTFLKNMPFKKLVTLIL